MKFSFSLLKTAAPSIPSRREFIEKMNRHAFETEDGEGDTVHIEIPANRYSDAASHAGIAVIARAIFGGVSQELDKGRILQRARNEAPFSAEVSEPSLCPRYMARHFELDRATVTPAWLKDILKTCGIQPVSAVVDILNYAMVETGEPMHAFDAAHIAGKKLAVRLAKEGEKIETLDGMAFTLSADDLVIADTKGPLAIAGIKGGARAGVRGLTKHIVIEAATFEAAGIYRTAKRLRIATDASARFAHGLNPALAERGIARATELLTDVCRAQAGALVDVKNFTQRRTSLKFHIEKFNLLTGLKLTEKQCVGYLRKLGFAVKGTLVTAPKERTDISIFEDVAEEVVNLHGYDRVPATPPHVPLVVPAEDKLVEFKERLRKLLPGFGLSEVYNYSFGAFGEVEIENPIAEDRRFLRSSLEAGLVKNISSNLRFFPDARIFEIGRVFARLPSEATAQGWINAKGNGPRTPASSQRRAAFAEKTKLGIALGSKRDAFILELKGVVAALAERLGIGELIMAPESRGALRVETAGHREVGMIKLFSIGAARGAVAELDVENLLYLITGERRFKPPPKYPGVVRDLSIVVSRSVATGDLITAIEGASGWLKDGVEPVDFYENPARIGAENQGMTFRLPFRSEDRTLKDSEVEKEFNKIVRLLIDRFDARVR